MSKTKISDYSSTPANNTDIGGINIAEGMLPSDVNNAIREQMAQLKNFQSGASGESVTFATVNATTISASNINKVTVTAPVTGSTLTIADGKTLTANNSLTLAGTDATTMTFPSTSATIARTDAAQTFTGTQTFSSALVLPAGTVSAPSFAPTGDTNTGIFFPAADTIAFAEGGVEAMRINSSGNVGIGTSSPQRRLHIEGSNNVGSTLRLSNTALVGGNYWDFVPQYDTESIAISNNGTERMRINSSGNVGIGTSSPASSLFTSNTVVDIKGPSSAVNRGGVLTLRDSNTINNQAFLAMDAGNFHVGTYTSGASIFYTNNTERMRITSAGEVLVGGTTSVINGTGLTIQKTGGSPDLFLFRNSTTVTSGQGFGGVFFNGNDTTSNTPTVHAYIQAVASGTHAAGDNPTDLVFGTTPDGTATVAEAGRITQSGAYVLKGGTTTAAAGVGIVFPATQVASADVNCLDDYEEGTWTPQYTFATSGTATMVSSSGTYTKIGRMVTVNFIATTSAVSSPTGAATITGLPFTSASGEAGGAIGEVRRFVTDMPNLRIEINASSSAITLLKQATNSLTSTAVDGADFSGTANYNRLHATITYFV